MLVALVLGAATYLTVHSALGARPPEGPHVEVAVVARPVRAGTALSGADVRTTRLPTVAVPDAAPAARPIGQTARVDLVPGEVLLASRLGSRGVAAMLPAGARALAVPRAAGTPPLEPGQHVDLLADGGVIVTAASVLAIDESGTTVAVPEAAAPVVAQAIAAGSVTLALAG
jgi:Flp pilus assembly protein CpaB